MTGRAIGIRIYKSRAERRCEYSAVAAYVRASAAVVVGIGDGCGNIAKMCRRTAGFGVVDGRKSSIHRLVEMVQRADPRTVVGVLQLIAAENAGSALVVVKNALRG